MKSTARSLIVLAAVAAPAVAPADLSAQHRAVPRPPVHGGYARPFYGSYYRPYYPYQPYYHGPSFGLSVQVDLPCDPSLCGAEVDVQAVEMDPGASKGVSFTQGLQVIFGQ